MNDYNTPCFNSNFGMYSIIKPFIGQVKFPLNDLISTDGTSINIEYIYNEFINTDGTHSFVEVGKKIIPNKSNIIALITNRYESVQFPEDYIIQKDTAGELVNELIGENNLDIAKKIAYILDEFEKYNYQMVDILSDKMEQKFICGKYEDYRHRNAFVLLILHKILIIEELTNKQFEIFIRYLCIPDKMKWRIDTAERIYIIYDNIGKITLKQTKNGSYIILYNKQTNK